MTTSTPSSAASTVARLWIAKMPAARTRIEKAIALVANVTPDEYRDDQFVVEGGEAVYTVTVNRANKTSTCTCPDHMERGSKCKHIFACGLYERCGK
jgi:uncharacterized Zn finger protein